MRSPREHLVGIATSPQGREFFSLRAEDELRMWLYVELCILGVNVSRYLEFLISLLRYPISALSTVQGIVGVDTYTGQHLLASSVEELETLGNWMRAERRAIALGCLIGASSFDANLSRIMMLVDEVMTRLDKVDGRNVNLMEEEFKIPNEEFHTPATNIEASMPAGSAYGTQEEFTISLQPVLIEEISRWTEKNIGTTYCSNTNNRINSYNNKNNEACNKNNNVSVVSNIEFQQPDNKNSFGFVESMERQREKDRLQLEIERLQLARLQAKFNEDVEAIWNGGLQIAQEEQQDCKLLQDRIIPPAPAIFPNSQPIFTIPDGSPMSVYSSGSKNGKIIDVDLFHSVSRLEAPISDIQNGELINVQDPVENSFKYNAGYNNTKNIKNWPDLISNDLWRRKGIEDNWVYLTRNIQAVGSFPVASCKPSHGSHIESPSILKLSNLPEPDEDLLTSARTHFRPIKDDGYWADGTTFPVNTAVEQVAYRRSESGNVWYLPGGESPYMEYRENDTASPVVPAILSSNLTPKFRVRQCDKSIQTDPVRFAVRRKLFFDDDCYDSTPLRGEDIVINKDEEEEEEEAVIEGEETVTVQCPKNKWVTENQDAITIDNEKNGIHHKQEIKQTNRDRDHNGNRKELEGKDKTENKSYDKDGDDHEEKESEDEEEGEQEQEDIKIEIYKYNQVEKDNEERYKDREKTKKKDKDEDDDEEEDEDEDEKNEDDDDNGDDDDNEDNDNGDDDNEGDDDDDEEEDDDDDENDDGDDEDENEEERKVENGQSRYEENRKEQEDEEDEDEEESDDDTKVVFGNEEERRKYILDRMNRAAVKINLADDREWKNCMNKVREKLLKKIGTDIFVTMPERIM
ncbi:protein PFC0760c-like [Odontomachus brunneus]|uniref:protein PFC0760c-like n=1 Tax=Odontomachus brunneus TaxID=486640 RepID=UPI0013F2725B|nr:protein PFC0760c-like [Odontomachus brunneus]XP_032686223.1 protein PFC0760c-like [Odontomachus brunneus]XP_032686224.1 protein PFC0760c-like [Odontomachus brunneus]